MLIVSRSEYRVAPQIGVFPPMYPVITPIKYRKRPFSSAEWAEERGYVEQGYV